MAKNTIEATKPSKLSKKKSQQELKAGASAKSVKTDKAAAKDAESLVTGESEATTSTRKDKKKQRVTAEAEVVEEAVDVVDGEKGGKKRKRKEAAATEHISGEVGEKTKKPKKSSLKAAPPSTSEPAVDEPAKGEDSNSKPKKKRNVEEVAADVDVPTKTSKKAKGKGAKPAPAPEPVVEESQEESEEEDAQEEQEFYGFGSDDDDSSDEEDISDEIPSIDVGKLPTIAKDDETVKRKLEKAKRKKNQDAGVIYLGRIPHGFYEDQMRAYFSQFGNVTRLRLSRNKKTGKPKHYGFVEFDSASVAQIVAETMDNYLLMGHILTCKVIPKDQVHPELWVGANRKWRPVPRARVARVEHNKPRTEEEVEKAERRLLKRQTQRKRKLEEAGIKYDFEAVAYKKKQKPVEA